MAYIESSPAPEFGTRTVGPSPESSASSYFEAPSLGGHAARREDDAAHEAAGTAPIDEEERKLLGRAECAAPALCFGWSHLPSTDDSLNRTLTVGATNTKAGTGRVLPLNERAFMTLQTGQRTSRSVRLTTSCFRGRALRLGWQRTEDARKKRWPPIQVGEIKTSVVNSLA